jgi:hypothetical protein
MRFPLAYSEFPASLSMKRGLPLAKWMGAGVVYRARLESVCTVKGTVGSNPTPSATLKIGTETPYLAGDDAKLSGRLTEDSFAAFATGGAVPFLRFAVDVFARRRCSTAAASVATISRNRSIRSE